MPKRTIQSPKQTASFYQSICLLEATKCISHSVLLSFQQELVLQEIHQTNLVCMRPQLFLC